jgi:uncharacterized protein
MRTADASILIIPGFGDSGPGHWQSRWESKLPSATRVNQPDWNRADRAQWAGAIANAVDRADKPVVLVAHSIGVAAVAHAAHMFTKPVAGAFLVGLSDWNREELLPGVPHDFAPIPRNPLAFTSWLIASRNDPWCNYEVAEGFANAWGSKLIDAGESGHINIESGHGPWPEGLMSFASFMRNL